MVNFLVSNWFLILLIGGFLLMHRRGGCGMHGHRGHEHGSHGDDRTEPAGEQPHDHSETRR